MSYPTARSESLVIQELSDELLICDTETYRAFCLNKTAGEVWKLCDGRRDAAQIARDLSKKLGRQVTEEVVWLALDQLSKENLLEEKLESTDGFKGFSRREVIRRVGLTSMVALPVISSLLMPTPAMAQSAGACGAPPLPLTCPCSDSTDCSSGCCDFSSGSGVCEPAGTGTCALGGPGDSCNDTSECQPGLECCAPGNPVCNPGC